MTSDGYTIPAEGVALGVGAYGAAGMGLGALVGALVKSERWQGADLDGPSMSVGPVPGGGIGFDVRVPFGRSR